MSASGYEASREVFAVRFEPEGGSPFGGSEGWSARCRSETPALIRWTAVGTSGHPQRQRLLDKLSVSFRAHPAARNKGYRHGQAFVLSSGVGYRSALRSAV